MTLSAFYQKLDEWIGTGTDKQDIRAVVRRCWFFDFDGYPIRVWQGQGRLHTEDGNSWLGTFDGKGNTLLRTPRISDGRDGTAPTYEFTLSIIDTPGLPAQEAYDALKSEQSRVRDRTITGYYALFENGEGLRPNTPLEFFKELTMLSSRFEEKLELDGTSLVRRYSVTIIAKDGNSGRSNIPGGTYSDTVQKWRAAQLGVVNDRGCEFVAGLADRTYHPQ